MKLIHLFVVDCIGCVTIAADAALLSNGNLRERLIHPFTEGEQAYAARFARPGRRFAARFAGKEAVMKSLGRGWRQIRWTDVEITGGGPPKVVLRGSAAARAAQLGVTEVLVTITHTDDTALVMAVAVGEH